MHTLWKSLALAGAVLILAGPSAHAPLAAVAPPCMRVSQINGFSYVDNSTVILQTVPRRKLKVTFVGQCRGLKWATSIRVDARPGFCLRPGDTVVVSLVGGLPERCFVQAIEPVKAAD